MTPWTLTVRTLRGQALPPLPAIAGRIHECRDEPLPAEMLAEITDLAEYRLCAGVGFEKAARILAERGAGTEATR